MKSALDKIAAELEYEYETLMNDKALTISSPAEARTAEASDPSFIDEYQGVIE